MIPEKRNRIIDNIKLSYLGYNMKWDNMGNVKAEEAKKELTLMLLYLSRFTQGEKMKNLFERTSSNWVRYSEYEWSTAEAGTRYLTPTKTA